MGHHTREDAPYQQDMDSLSDVPFDMSPPPLYQGHQKEMARDVSPQTTNIRGEAEVTLAQRVNDVAAKLDLETELVEDLVSWAGTEVVVVADDSNSMRAIADVQRQLTRWDELRERLGQLLDILLMIDDDGGFELRFLNCGGPVMIRTQADLQAVWQWAQPSGRTPLGSVLREYLNPQGLENDRLLMILTDGCPSDVTFEQLRTMIKKKDHRVFISVMMCTEEDDVVEKYNTRIDPIRGVDVLDDYASEKREVERFRGRKLTMNKYLCKCVLGPKFPKWDNLDEHNCSCAIS